VTGNGLAHCLLSGARIYKGLWFVNKKPQYGVNMGSYALALVTIDNMENASRIAHFLVQNKLAACVNIVPEIRSVYYWNGQVQDDFERLLLIKTTLDRFPELRKRIRELHPYQVPEIICLSIDQGLPEYLQWIDESLSRSD
jgi:periplasmic divalent cation tolerance protein